MNLAPFKLERYFARYEFNTEYLLCSSDCESLRVEDLLAMETGAEAELKHLWLGYTESAGAPALRAEIARIYTTIQPEQVLVTSGAEEAIFLFMQAALGAGSHAVVHWPCYQSLSEVAQGMGCEVSRWEARHENGWRLDLDELKSLLRANTHAVIVNTPHNPTGMLMEQSEYAALAELCEAHGIRLFCDEVYRELEYEKRDRLSAGCDLSPTAISLGVMSKTYGLAGLRIGWVATHDAEMLRRMAALKDYTTICASAPSEALAALALRHREKLAERNLGIIAANFARLDDFFTAQAGRLEWVRPHAGPITFPRLLQGKAEAFCERLVREQGVLLLPGTLFDHPGNHFRVGFGRANLPAALARLEEFMQSGWSGS